MEPVSWVEREISQAISLQAALVSGARAPVSARGVG